MSLIAVQIGSQMTTRPSMTDFPRIYVTPYWCGIYNKLAFPQ